MNKLFILQVHYDKYNQRFGKDGIHDPLDWSEVGSEVTAFKEKFIFPTIVDTEIQEKSYPFVTLILNYHTLLVS